MLELRKRDSRLRAADLRNDLERPKGAGREQPQHLRRSDQQLGAELDSSAQGDRHQLADRHRSADARRRRREPQQRHAPLQRHLLRLHGARHDLPADPHRPQRHAGRHSLVRRSGRRPVRARERRVHAVEPGAERHPELPGGPLGAGALARDQQRIRTDRARPDGAGDGGDRPDGGGGSGQGRIRRRRAVHQPHGRRRQHHPRRAPAGGRPSGDLLGDLRGRPWRLSGRPSGGQPLARELGLRVVPARALDAEQPLLRRRFQLHLQHRCHGCRCGDVFGGPDHGHLRRHAPVQLLLDDRAPLLVRQGVRPDLREQRPLHHRRQQQSGGRRPAGRHDVGPGPGRF